MEFSLIHFQNTGTPECRSLPDASWDSGCQNVLWPAAQWLSAQEIVCDLCHHNQNSLHSPVLCLCYLQVFERWFTLGLLCLWSLQWCRPLGLRHFGTNFWGGVTKSVFVFANVVKWFTLSLYCLDSRMFHSLSLVIRHLHHLFIAWGLLFLFTVNSNNVMHSEQNVLGLLEIIPN